MAGRVNLFGLLDRINSRLFSLFVSTPPVWPKSQSLHNCLALLPPCKAGSGCSLVLSEINQELYKEAEHWHLFLRSEIRQLRNALILTWVASTILAASFRKVGSSFTLNAACTRTSVIFIMRVFLSAEPWKTLRAEPPLNSDSGHVLYNTLLGIW